jgi:hypothetical protein
MKTTGRIASLLALAATAIGILMFMKKEENQISSDGYIGKSNIVIEDGKMSPEALLAFGRMSDPQVSPDGKHILYGVSYTSVEENRSVRNLFICNIDGTGNRVGLIVYGPRNIIVVAGMNKVCQSIEDAVRRARTVAAPMNQQRFGLPNPCTCTGVCADCLTETSICNQILITRNCKPAGRIKFVLVGEELGF